MIKLGDFVRDEVTGFEGVVLARSEALYEATQCRVHVAELKQDGEMRASVWIEEGRLKVQPNHARQVGFLTIQGKL